MSIKVYLERRNKRRSHENKDIISKTERIIIPDGYAKNFASMEVIYLAISNNNHDRGCRPMNK